MNYIDLLVGMAVAGETRCGYVRTKSSNLTTTKRRVPMSFTGEELYEVIYQNKEKMQFVIHHTPLFCEDERINILWLWCMENKDKYDPSVSNLTGWVLGVSRRVIDAYRKERGLRTKQKTVQFPFAEDLNDSVENVVKDHRLYHDTTEKYGNHEYGIDKKDSIENMWKVINQVIAKVDNKAILQNYAQVLEDEVLSKSLNVKKITMQTRRTQYKRKVQDALQKKNARDR